MQSFAGRIAVIEDDDSLREAVVRISASWGAEVAGVATAAEARDLLSKPPPPELILIDVRLPDDSAFGVLEIAARLSPVPIIVAMSGKASPDEAFRLAQHGASAYLPKPFSIGDLEAAVEKARSAPPSLEPLIAASVGRVPMRDLQRDVREVMVKEALARAHGSRSGAARLLHVTRQAVQQIIRGKDAGADPGSGSKSMRPLG